MFCTEFSISLLAYSDPRKYSNFTCIFMLSGCDDIIGVHSLDMYRVEDRKISKRRMRHDTANSTQQQLLQLRLITK